MTTQCAEVVSTRSVDTAQLLPLASAQLLLPSDDTEVVSTRSVASAQLLPVASAQLLLPSDDIDSGPSSKKVDLNNIRHFMDKLKLEIESSMRRYEQDMNRMLDLNRGLEEDQRMRLARQPTPGSKQNPQHLEGSRANKEVATANVKQAWPSAEEEQPTTGLEGRQELSVIPSVTFDNRVTSMLERTRSKLAAPEEEPCHSKDSTEQYSDLSKVRRKSTWVNMTQQGANIDSMVRELAEQMEPPKDCLQRIAEFRVNAPAAVPPNSVFHRIVKSGAHRLIRGLFFLCDAFVLIAELHHDANTVAYHGGPSERPAFLWASTMFLIYMWCEMILNFVLEFPNIDIIYGRTGIRWIIETAIIQHTLAVIGAQALPGQRYTSNLRIFISHFNFIRILRTMIVLPGLGGQKLRQQLGELHIMIKALTHTFWPLFWCTVMYFIILVIFGVFFTEGAATSLMTGATNLKDLNAEDTLMVESWIGVDTSILSLTKAMLAGKDWGEAYDSLNPAGSVPKLAFIVFICFTQIALLNTVTAVFIKCAFMKFEHDREFIVQQEHQDKRDYLLSVRRIFIELDEDESGYLNLEELDQHLKNPEIAAYFTRLGVDTDEVQSVFYLMDEDHDGTISLEEFLWGCFRLRGSAKTLDLEILRQDVRFALSMLLDIENTLKNTLKIHMMERSPARILNKGST